ncbi:MAG: LytTR family DNA-binding domain-containing protein [Bacteroidota bacterium]|nr:LytTR family DNA-binding domain-containing protein [Bacteroidota bacterium]
MGEKILKVILIDDEPQAISVLEQILLNYPRLKICGKITDPGIAMSVIRDIKPDLVFLDIEMPGKDGFEILKEINDLGLNPWIIFVTAFDQFAIRALRSAAFDYLLKPVDLEELDNAIVRLFRMLSGNSPENDDNPLSEKTKKLIVETTGHGKIKISTGNGFIFLRPEDIFYILADWNYSEIYYSQYHHDIVTTNLGSIWKMLPSGSFFRITRSLIVNLKYLSKVNRKKRQIIINKDGDECSFTIPLLNLRKMERFLDSNH